MQMVYGKNMMKLQKPTKQNLIDLLLTLPAAVSCGIGSGLINAAGFGMDAIGVFYDGVRTLLKLSPEQIGTASYVVCAAISAFLLIFGWKNHYVSVGSVVYLVFYGFSANLGSVLGFRMTADGQLFLRILCDVLGFAMLYLGLTVYITVDIGVDAFTGLMLFICDKTKGSMKLVKILFDLALFIIGILMGGTFGVMSVVCIVIGGPVLSFLTARAQKLYFKHSLKEVQEEPQDKKPE